MQMDWWRDPESAWWAKVDRAKHHLAVLEREITAFLASGSYEISAEPGDAPGETLYRLRIHQEIPVRFSTAIGDVLHNLRSALDCAAYYLALRKAGDGLDERSERSCQFPICKDMASFAEFFRKRPGLYGPVEQEAMKAVQPGRIHDQAVALGIQMGTTDREIEVAHDHLWTLATLSNIDKHRKLHVTMWWPDLLYWASDGPSRRRWVWGNPPFNDGSILGKLCDDLTHPEPPGTLYDEIKLSLNHRGARFDDVCRMLHSIQDGVTWALQSVFLHIDRAEGQG